MSSEPNLQGGFQKRVNVIQNGTNESTTTLRTIFLKNSENFSLQVTDFFLNKIPTLFEDENRTLITIEQYGSYTDAIGWQNHFPEAIRQYKPRNVYTVVDLIKGIQAFLNEFCHTLLLNGYETGFDPAFPGVHNNEMPNFSDAVVAELLEETHNVNFVPHHFGPVTVGDVIHFDIDTGYKSRFLESRLCKVYLTNENRIEIAMHQAFAFNFFLNIEPSFAERLGLSEEIFVVRPDGGIENVGDDGEPITTIYTPEDEFIDEIEDRDVLNTQKGFYFKTGQNDVNSVDRRISIDIECQFPLSSKVVFHREKEGRDFILARFPFTELKEFRSKTYIDDAGTTKRIIIERFPNGLHNMTGNNMNYESNTLINGRIEQMNIKLIVVYEQEDGFIRKALDCVDGIWELSLLFSKKI